MSASATEKRGYLIGYISSALVCFIFQLVYERFSHGVTSRFMELAFLIPLAGAALTYLSFRLRPGKRGNLCRQFINGGLIWLTLGSIYQGALEIYGTTNRLIIVFAIAGALQLAAALIVCLLPRRRAA